MSRPWMPLYVETFLTHTDHLSAIETGAYLSLIMSYWIKRSLPQTDRALARIARMTDVEWEEHRESIASFFNPDWTHDRVEEELRKSDEAYEKRAKAGQKGGKSSKPPPKPKPGSSNASGNGSGNASAKPNLKLKQDTSISSEIEGRPTPEKQLFDRAVEVLGEKGRGLCARVFHAKDRNVALTRAAIEAASTKSNPSEYLAGCIRAGPRASSSDGAVTLARKLEDELHDDPESLDHDDRHAASASDAGSAPTRYSREERDRDQRSGKSYDLLVVGAHRH